MPIPEDETSSTTKLSFLSRNHSRQHHSRKPKTSITKTNSSFVQKIITNDQLAKILMSRTSDDTNLFYNCGTSFIWMDASGNPKVARRERSITSNTHPSLFRSPYPALYSQEHVQLHMMLIY